MTKIIKHQGWWKQKGWFVVALVGILLQLVAQRNNPYFLVPLLILGAVGVYVVFFTDILKEDFITWDKTAIKIKEDGQEYSYTKDDIDKVSFSKNHLKIKSGPANGILVDLKGYAEKDILLLEAFFDSSQRIAPEVLA